MPIMFYRDFIVVLHPWLKIIWSHGIHGKVNCNYAIQKGDINAYYDKAFCSQRLTLSAMRKTFKDTTNYSLAACHYRNDDDVITQWSVPAIACWSIWKALGLVFPSDHVTWETLVSVSTILNSVNGKIPTGPSGRARALCQLNKRDFFVGFIE